MQNPTHLSNFLSIVYCIRLVIMINSTIMPIYKKKKQFRKYRCSKFVKAEAAH